MHLEEINRSQIILTKNTEDFKQALSKKCPNNRIVYYEEEDFKVEHTKAIIKEAYIAEANQKYIVLIANTINTIAQNALLKIYEEPPRNIIFLLVIPSKSILLSTIRSRLPITQLDKTIEHFEFDLNIKNLNLDSLYIWIKKQNRLNKQEYQQLVQGLLLEVHKAKIKLTQEELDAYDKAYRLIDLNGRGQIILLNLLLALI